jgi:elongation factor P--(R)-beta-lysine ligase
VDTPITAKKVIPEATIELMSTTIHGINDDTGESAYLLPSPEIYMKRLLAAGVGSIFQFSRCFRDCEAPSRLHSHEFLMLEWYTIKADYMDSLERTEELLKKLGRECGISPSAKPALSSPFLRMTIEEAFREFAGLDLAACGEIEALREAAVRNGFEFDATLEWADLFHLILVAAVEPKLPRDRPVVLLDYPVQVECLAKIKKKTPWRERWELYLGGIETANCYTEMVTPAEVKTYFAKEATRSGGGLGEGGVADTSFPEIYDGAHPPCSGVAMGIDRLIMALAGARSIAEIMPFP